MKTRTHRLPSFLKCLVLLALVQSARASGVSLPMLFNGTVIAWGLNFFGQTNVPASATGVVAIAGGAYHSLALRGDGTVIAWGAGTNNTGLNQN